MSLVVGSWGLSFFVLILSWSVLTFYESQKITCLFQAICSRWGSASAAHRTLHPFQGLLLQQPALPGGRDAEWVRGWPNTKKHWELVQPGRTGTSSEGILAWTCRARCFLSSWAFSVQGHCGSPRGINSMPAPCMAGGGESLLFPRNGQSQLLL